MPFTLTMPKLSPTMNTGTIVKWIKKVGEWVELGDVLIEVATDKATVEYEAIDNGYLRKIIVQEGQEAIVNQPIAIFSENKEESIEGFLPPIEEKKLNKTHVVSEKEEHSVESFKYKEVATLQQPSFVPEPALENYTFKYPRSPMESRVFASPLAKKIAREKGLDLLSIKGSGPNGRIMSRDLAQAQTKGGVAFSPWEIPKVNPGSYEEVPLSPIRKVIAQRLQESKSFIPHFYVTQEIDARPLVEMREQLKNGEIKVSINDLIIRACALSLRKHLEINSGFNSVNQTVVQFQTVDIAVAVGLEQGLITPIVRHADYKSVGEISQEIRFLVQRAKEGKLDPQEYKGGSFTISNLGMYGVTDFQAIINPPQAAILAVSAIRDVPVVRQGNVVAGQMMNLTLSVDHRVVDGVGAAKFLKSLKDILENPALLL